MEIKIEHIVYPCIYIFIFSQFHRFLYVSPPPEMTGSHLLPILLFLLWCFFFSLHRDDPVPPNLAGGGAPPDPHQHLQRPPPPARPGQNQARAGAPAPAADPALPTAAAPASTGAREAAARSYQGIAMSQQTLTTPLPPTCILF